MAVVVWCGGGLVWHGDGVVWCVGGLVWCCVVVAFVVLSNHGKNNK